MSMNFVNLIFQTQSQKIFLLAIFTFFVGKIFAVEFKKDNGDLYIAEAIKMYNESDYDKESTIDNDENFVTKLCNSSFSIPIAYIEKFNDTAELPNTEDKTGMCFIRCFFEKTGIIENWKLNVDKIRRTIWPATGDSIPVCEKEGNNETNACVRAYTIAKCLMIRAIVDARNKPT